MIMKAEDESPVPLCDRQENCIGQKERGRNRAMIWVNTVGNRRASGVGGAGTSRTFPPPGPVEGKG